MSLLRLPPDLQDSFEIVTRPKRLFSSSSIGISGSVRVYPDIGTSQKEVPKESNTDAFNSENLEELRSFIVNSLRSPVGAGVKSSFQNLLNFSNQSTGNSFTVTGSSGTSTGAALTISLVDTTAAGHQGPANTIQILRNRYASGSITITGTTPGTQKIQLRDTAQGLVDFLPDSSATTAAKVDANNYTFGIDGASDVETIATRLHASIALSKTNNDLSITAISPGGGDTIPISQDVAGTEGNTPVIGAGITSQSRYATTTGFTNGQTFNDRDIASLVTIAFTGESALNANLSGGAIGDTVDIVYAASGLGIASSSIGVNGLVANKTPFVSINSTTIGESGNNITFADVGGEVVATGELKKSPATLLNGAGKLYNGGINQYLDKVNELPQSVMRGKNMEVIRFEPSFDFSSNTVRKKLITDTLFSYYAGVYPGASDFSFTNYHTLNFFDSSTVPSDSVLIYPSPPTETRDSLYRPTGSFTLQCYVNPRYTSDSIAAGFPAGTILHMSSTFALSLVSGSAVDLTGKTSGYRLMLQLSHSADVSPSSVDIASVDAGTAGYPNDLIFLSKDNSLSKDVWEHVAVRWGTIYEQAGTGSFVIGGEESTTFSVPSASLGPNLFGPAKGEPSALFVGNYYEGQNSDIDLISLFFNSTTAKKDGIADLWSKNYSVQDPRTYNFGHPLNAELHELKIFDVYRNNDQILFDRDYGSPDLQDEGLLFYLPPYFVRETPERDTLVTPFATTRRSTHFPFNTDMSFGVGGHLLNLENFTKDLKNDVFPRLLNLSASVTTTATDWSTANAHLYASGSIRKRNLTILPNDNGKFIPDFGILTKCVMEEGDRWPYLMSGSVTLSEKEQLGLYKNDRENEDLSVVTLRNYVATGSISFPNINEGQSDIANSLMGPTPNDPFRATDASGQVLSIYMKNRDPNSQEVCFFDISNIFYGQSIFEKSFSITDQAVTGSGGKVKITLKDHNGILHRADCTGSIAQWNSVGTILYEEGLVVIKSPVLPLFGKESYECNLRGENSVYSRRVSIPIDPGELGFSSNPTYITDLRPTDLTPDFDERFTYITDVDILDENMNVVARASFAQPIVKRDSDNFLIRCKMDF